MSSHHIVREKQEPALLVLGLNGFDHELLGQLLEWSPTIMATLTAAETLNSLGIKIDMLIDNGSDVTANLQSDMKYLPAQHDNSLQAALEYLTAHNYPAVNIVTDELLLTDYYSYAAKINMVIFHQGKKIYAVTSGFSKWKPSGETIELLGSNTDVQTVGLEPLNQARSFVTVNDGFFTLQFNEPYIFIAESLN